MEQPTFQQSHHTELITANLSAAISDYISDKTNSCSVFSSHLFFNKVRTASWLGVGDISVLIRWGTGTSTVCAEHYSAPRAALHSSPVITEVKNLLLCHLKAQEQPQSHWGWPAAPALLTGSERQQRPGGGSAHAPAGQVTNKETQGQGFRGTVGARHVLGMENYKTDLGYSDRKGVMQEDWDSYKYRQKAGATGANHPQYISNAQEQPWVNSNNSWVWHFSDNWRHDCCLIKAVFLYHITIAECKTYTTAGVILAQVVAVFNSQGTHTLHTGFPSQVHKGMVWQWHQPGNNNCLQNLLLLIPKEIRNCLRSSNGTITPRKGSCDVAL